MDVIGSLQLVHLERRAVPHNEQNLALASLHSELGGGIAEIRAFSSTRCKVLLGHIPQPLKASGKAIASPQIT